MSFLAELRRRNVIRMAGVYLVGAWLMVQVTETLLPIFDTPAWVLKTLVALLALGFVPALVFSWLYELTPEGLKRDAEVPPGQSIAAQTGRRMDRLIVAGLVAVVAAIAADRYWPRGGEEEKGPESISGAEAPATTESVRPEIDSGPFSSSSSTPAKKSIAVLAFDDLSPGKDQEYFSDGIADEILLALSKVRDLKVAGRTSAFHFKGRHEDLRTIGRTLGVAHVLEGSVRKQGDRVRITAQLIQVEDGFHLWSEAYEGDLDDVFELQERIARKITDALRVVLQGRQQEQLVPVPTTNPEAYARYLRATDIFNRRDIDRFGVAISLLEEALALDPGFARAHSRLAAVHVLTPNYTNVDFATAFPPVERHARLARELDPTLAEPDAALGFRYGSERRYAEERQAYERALALDPDDATANLWFGVSLMTQGYRARGASVLDRLLELDPMLPNALNWRARGYLDAGDLDSAERLARRAVDAGFAARGSTLSDLALARHRLDAALPELTDFLAINAAGFPPQAPAVFARACLGDASAKSEAIAIIDAYLDGKPATISGLVPYVLLRSGEIARGLALMQEAPTLNETIILGSYVWSIGRNVRTAPEFAQFARRSGLAAWWDQEGPPDHCRKADSGDYVCE